MEQGFSAFKCLLLDVTGVERSAKLEYVNENTSLWLINVPVIIGLATKPCNVK